jgi:hypothetical protein
MVYEITEHYACGTSHDLGKDKESVIKGVQKGEVVVVVHH